ncbi:TetR/AcrR family transcriptional regulator [Myxococcaceae bacterium GXIMD 01537]
MTRPATRDPEATRGAIMKAAFQLFVEKGFSDTAVSEIARMAEVTQSLIHHHFGSKLELWRELARGCGMDFNNVLEEHLRNTQGSLTLDSLRTLLRGYFHHISQRPDLMRFFQWMSLENPYTPDRKELEMEVHGRLTRYLGSLQEAGVLRQDIQTKHLLSTIHGLLFYWGQAGQQFSKWMGEDLNEAAEAYLDTALKVFIEGAAQKH